MSAAIETAKSAQSQAADPRGSAFVSANAGSGKTHVLINRVTRLLMAGVKPQNILCVTYTKAAAAEMLNRLFGRLGEYSIMDDAALGTALRELDPAIPIGKADLRRARALFALALETPGGLKIRTIHAFCESLLRRFPAEAGISPGFTVLDDRLGAELRGQSIAHIGEVALQEPKGAVARAITHVAGMGADALDQLYGFAAREGRRLAQLMQREGGLEAALSLSARALGVPVGATPQSEAAAGWDRLDKDIFKRMAQDLATGGATDKKCAAAITRALQDHDKTKAIDHLLGGFFTQSGTAPKNLPTKAVQKNHPAIAEEIANIQFALETVRDRIQAAMVLQNTRAALVLVEAFYGHYTRAKATLGALDFDDLIEKSVALVEQSEAASWVLYKLDYDLDHILVDEAQDNSDGQWALIRRLSGEFFAGKGSSEKTRTLFAVGDPKQSIYSFQGANPALFQSEAERLKVLTRQSRKTFYLPELALSWRSTAQVLAMVDETFSPFAIEAPEPPALETKFVGDAARFQKDAAISPGFVGYVPHQAQRAKAVGSVELWDPIPRPVDMPAEDPAAPVDAPAPQSARNQLAANIAIGIEGWLSAGELISEKRGADWHQRPLRPGDIMILVRSRTGGLFDEIIRQLKLRAIAVAGADRMVLAKQTAVLDMMSAARAAVLEDDDLALAEFLKSPFLHPASSALPIIDEEALYALAADRPQGQSLSEVLQHSEDPRFAEARDLVTDLRQLAGTVPPFAFFATLLYRASHTGESYARRLYARLGPEAEDPVREFLNKAQAHQSEQTPSLARFVAQNIGDETQIKREMEGAGNAVRVMTVHAAKGLEAPLVILPDTAKGPGRHRDSGLMFGPEGALFWSPQKKNDPGICQIIRERTAHMDADESKRLLYVAMTRAQDRLIICGAKQGRGEGAMHAEGWYAHCENAFARLADQGQVEDFETVGGLAAKRYGAAPKTVKDLPDAVREAETSLPGWARCPLPADIAPPRRTAPSRWLQDEDDRGAVLSPLAMGGAKRYQRGLLIHTLLQALPAMDPAARQSAAHTFLQAQLDLDEEQRRDIIAAVFGVLQNPEFAPLFGPDSRAELPISGQMEAQGEALIIAGQMDRLVVTDEEVMVVDYKTNRPAPRHVEEVPGAYLRQMAAYRALLRSLWPNRKIRCALLWTDGPHLMPLADSLLDQAMQNRANP
ncbi:MAG: double-strand break repair helicase AddA [Robiginitomaculum sp.]|nr:double-strand break repair helicase AddA [Robiginitomaculum sp.]MDQ7076709.1 double-strand break repair helicase AddA [Robiginitomaculum sp.]